MATVLDEFLVKLGYSVDTDSEAKFKASVDNARKVALKMSAAVVGAATAGGVALVKLSQSFSRKFFDAKFAGSTVANVEKVGLAFKLLGGSVQDALGIFTTMSNNIKNMPGFEATIQRWGVKTRDANGELRDTAEIFKELIPILQKAAQESPAGLARVRKELSENFGMNDKQMNIVLNPDFLKKMDEASRLIDKTGADLDKNAKTAQKFAEQWEKFKTAFSLAGSDAMMTFLEASGFAEIMEKATNGIVENFSKIHDWAGRIGAKVKGFIEFVEKYFFKKEPPPPNGNGDGSVKGDGKTTPPVGATAPPEDAGKDAAGFSIIPDRKQKTDTSEDIEQPQTEVVVKTPAKVKPKKVVEVETDDQDIDVSPAIKSLTSKENLEKIDKNTKRYFEERDEIQKAREALERNQAATGKAVRKNSDRVTEAQLKETKKTGAAIRRTAEKTANQIGKTVGQAAKTALDAVIPPANASINRNVANYSRKSWTEGEGIAPSRRITALNTRAFRNNNFGNVRDAKTQKFKVFDTPEAGIEAAARQFKYYFNAGFKNLYSIFKTYAPKEAGDDPKKYAENVAAYLSKKFGANIDKTTDLDLSDPEILKAIVEASIDQESKPGAHKYLEGEGFDAAIARAVTATYKSRAIKESNRVASTGRFDRTKPVAVAKQEKKPYFASPYAPKNPDVAGIKADVAGIRKDLKAPKPSPMDRATESIITNNSSATTTNVAGSTANINITINGAGDAARETVRGIQEGLDRSGMFPAGIRYAYSGGSVF